jgi:hypothetical protein
MFDPAPADAIACRAKRTPTPETKANPADDGQYTLLLVHVQRDQRIQHRIEAKFVFSTIMVPVLQHHRLSP